MKIGSPPPSGPQQLGSARGPDAVQHQPPAGRPQGSALAREGGDRYVGQKPPTTQIPLGKFMVRIPNAPNLVALMDKMMQHLGKTPPPALMQDALATTAKFSDIDGLMQFARSHGLQAEAFNHATIAEMKACIRADAPVLALTQGPAEPQDKQPAPLLNGHWVAVIGEDSQINIAEGKVDKFLLVEDPSGRLPAKIPEESFEAQWKGLQMMGADSGYENLFVAVGMAGAAMQRTRLEPRLNPVRTTLHGLAGFNEGKKKIFEYVFVSGLGDLIGGGLEAMGGLIGLKLLRLSDALRRLAERVLRWSRTLLAAGGWIAALPAGAGLLAYGGLRALEYAAGGAGIVLSTLCGFIGRGIRDVASSIQIGLAKFRGMFRRNG